MHNRPLKSLPVSLLLAMAGWTAPVAGLAAEEGPAADGFAALVEQFQADVKSLSDAQVLEFLAKARQAHKPFVAFLAMKDYFAQNFSPKPEVVLAAADNAALAGQWSSAASYYKRYLKDASVSEQSSKAAAKLYTIYTVYLNREDDAFSHMVASELKFRSSSDMAKAFDVWFLGQARKRRNLQALAVGLRSMLADSPSEASMRQFIVPAMDTAFGQLKSAKAKEQDIVEIFAGLIDQGNIDASAKARYRFAVSVFNFQRTEEVEGEKKADGSIAALLRSAGDYVSQSKSGTALRDVSEALGIDVGNGKWESKKWSRQKAAKLAFVIEQFGKLSAAEQQVFLGRGFRNSSILDDLGTPAEWYAAGARDKQLFGHHNIWRYNLDQMFSKSGDFAGAVKGLAGVVGNHQGAFGIVVRSLAAGKDLSSVAQHYFSKESWSLAESEVLSLWRNVIEPGVVRLSGKDINAAEWMKIVGKPWLAGSPLMANNKDMVGLYLKHAWNASKDKTQFQDAVKAISWLPLNRDARRSVSDFNSRTVRRHFDTWANKLRREKKKMTPEQIAQAEKDVAIRGKVEGTLNALTANKGLDPAAAPNDIAKAYLGLILAGDDADKQKEHGKVLLAHVGSFAQSKTPLARVYFRALLTRADRKQMISAFQGEVLMALVGNYSGEAKGTVHAIIEDTTRTRRDWPTRIRSEHRAGALLLNNALASALKSDFGKGSVSHYIWERFLQTRRGRGWHESKANADVLEMAIDKNLLTKLYPGNTRMATVEAMRLVNREFTTLKSKYPLASHFDQAFVAEAKSKRFVSAGYWENGGKDQSGAVAAAAAEILAGYQYLPRDKYTPEELSTLTWRVFGESASKVDPKYLGQIESHFGKRYDTTALGAMYFAQRPKLTDAGTRSEYFSRLKQTMQRMAKLPYLTRHPDMSSLKDVKADSLSKDEVDVLLRLLVDHPFGSWSSNNGSELLIAHLLTALQKAQRYEDLVAAAPQMWRGAAALRKTDIMNSMTKFCAELIKDDAKMEYASSIAASGLAVAKAGLEDHVKRELDVIVSRVQVSQVGAIPVAKNDPAYPVYFAQQNWRVDRKKGAWDSYRAKGAKSTMMGMYSKLDPNFVHWIISEHTKREQYDEAEGLVRSVLTWMDDVGTAIEPEARANFLLARADLAFHRKEFPVARSQYQFIGEAEEFAGLRPQLVGLLMMAEVDRMTKRYDEAKSQLNKLLRRPDTYVIAMAKFYLAKIKFDQDSFSDALDLVNESLDRYEDNQDAKLFRNEVQKRLNNYMDSTNVDLGTALLRTKMVPGHPLTIQLKDKNKALAKRASSIELTVTVKKTGDRETMVLAMLGESGNLFSATLPTEMNTATAGDGKLQVLGNDEVTFDLSEEFKRKTNFQGGGTSRTLKVHSDPELYASSADIKTKAELEELALRAKIAALAGLETGRKDQWETAEGAGVALSEVRSASEIRPGNSFNVQVVDLDMNYTDGIDNIVIDVSTSSGDRIRGYSVNETDAFSGTFAGKVQTAKRPPYALASDSLDGHDPNVVVSPNKSGDLPPWIGKDGITGPRHLTVDLNDLVHVGKTQLKVTGVEDKAPKGLIIQTSLNNRSFTTVGSWPQSFSPWDGSLQVDVIPGTLPTDGRDAYASIQDHFGVKFLHESSGRKRITPASNSMKIAWSDLQGIWSGVAGKGAAKNNNKKNDRRRRGGNQAGPMVSVRMRGAFWIPQRVTKQFYVLHKLGGEGRGRNTAGPQLYIDGVLVNQAKGGGRRGAKEESTGPQGFPFELTKGLHVMEVIYQVPASGGDKAEVAIKTNITEPPYTADIAPELFDLTQVPAAVMDDWKAKPVTVQQDSATKNIDLDFNGTGTRVVRFWITDHEGDSPAMQQITLSDTDGKQVLPNAADYTELRQNDVLEIAPGDTIQITYTDKHLYDSDGSPVREAYMKSTYYNGGVSAAFVTHGKQGEDQYHAIRRFDIGDTVKIFVRDNDLDTTDAEDKVDVTITTSEGKKLTITAIETEPHSGIFRGTFFPVDKEPEAGKSQLKVVAGDDLTIKYRDDENTDPGIPWNRTSDIEQAIWVDPQFRVYSSKSQQLPPDELAALEEAGKGGGNSDAEAGDSIKPMYRMIIERPADSLAVNSASEAIKAVIGGPLLAEATWPTVCKSTNSTLTIYAQTKRGRERARGSAPAPAAGAEGAEGAEGAAPADAAPATASHGPFDLSVPGTIKLTSGPGMPGGGTGNLPPGYLEALTIGGEQQQSPMDAGTFGFSIPVKLGECPQQSLVDEDGSTVEDYALFVTAGDEIYVGFKYEDQSGKEHWFTQTVRLVGDALFDVMDRSFEDYVTERYVGEQIFMRVVDPMRDISSKKDDIELKVSTESGFETVIPMKETLSHSGIFKGLIEFVHKDDKGGLEAKALQNGIPVKYGDTVTLTYSNGDIEISRQVAISKGANGEVLPFTKKFKDPEIAMRTIFSIAEAYFEMAKKHRLLAEEAKANDRARDQKRMERLARDEIKQGRKLLSEAIRDFPENQIRAQADYLRAELALELAKDTKLDSKKTEYYQEALFLFGDIISRYQDSEYAPKAQFKKALVYEKMNKMDLACAEYVKLSYKYPGNELIAETIARLGNYFLTEGDRLNKESEAQVGKDDIKAAEIKMQAKEMFTTAGRVFSKLREHFPEHQLAAQTAVAAGMCMMWGENWQKAHDLLTSVIDDPSVEKPDTKAEAYYWLGDTYVRMLEASGGKGGGATIKIKDGTQEFNAAAFAYQTFTKLTWEYPETKWAKFARGQLAGNPNLRSQ